LVDAELDWREWTEQQGNKREAVTFKARQVLFEGGRPSADNANGTGTADSTPVPQATPVPVAAATDSPTGSPTAPTRTEPEQQMRTTCRSERREGIGE
jgi:single-stranded DNA-binding protein